MNVLIVSKRLGYSGCLQLGRRSLAALGLTAVAGAVLLAYGTYRLGQNSAPALPVAVSPVEASYLQEQLDNQRRDVADAKRSAEENLDALTRRLAQLQARVIRLDALGQRLTHLAGMTEGEFDFTSVPAQGGPSAGAGISIPVTDFVAQLDELSQQLEDRRQQLSLLESLLMNRNLLAEIVPEGRPLESGWISSGFGKRTDPFTGKQGRHHGIDLAGKEGSDIVAVAAGVVVFSGTRSGYGKLVEIDHGNGYVTLYGHNKENLVQAGERVRKGQPIAKLGSTGRSTGPHVHFEVLRDGKAVNPMTYVRAAG